jgi:hypothetical protein
MIFTKVAWIAGLAVFAAMCWLAIIGFSPVVPLLITAIALFVLIGGGNLVNGRASPYGSRGGRPPRGTDGPDGPGPS